MILTCLSAMIINLTPYPFDARDMGTLTRAHLVCEKKHSGCVSNFTKTGKRSFKVVCGDKMLYDRKEYDKMVLETIHHELRHLTPEEKKKALEKIGITGE